MSDMDHSYIDEHGIIERYVTRRLAPEQEQDFETHMLDCAQCVGEIEAVQLLRRGLQADHEDASRTGVPVAGRRLKGWLADFLLGHSGLAAAALLLVALLPSAAVYWSVGSADLDPAALTGALVRGDAKLLTMAPVRGTQDRPSYQVRIGDDPVPLVVLLEFEPQGCEVFAATLTDPQDAVLWTGTGLTLNSFDTVSLVIEPALLAPGDYRFEVSTGAACTPPGNRVATYGLRVVS